MFLLLLIISLVLFIVNGQIPCDDEYGIIAIIITLLLMIIIANTITITTIEYYKYYNSNNSQHINIINHNS